MKAIIGKRGRFLLSLAALVIVLPTAILLHTKGNVIDLLVASEGKPTIVTREQSVPYASAEWRFTGLTRLPGDIPGSTFILAEFEATPLDASVLELAGPCTVTLQDDRGRRWEPLFLTEDNVREARPDAVEKPRCDGVAQGEDGHAIDMAEVFLLPTDASGLTLGVTLAGAAPDTLVFK